MQSSDVVVILTTLPISADAESFARALVDERLAACVSVYGEVTSIFRWQEGVQTDHERQVMIKTTAGRVSDVKTRFANLHPYEVPEFLVLTCADGGETYLKWVRESVVSAIIHENS